MAAEIATARDVRDLRELVGEPRARIGDAEAFVTADMAFHARIAQISANPILMATSQAMLRWLFQHHSVLLHWSGKEKTTLEDHDEIVDLIAARDVNGAVAAMAAHLDRSTHCIATTRARRRGFRSNTLLVSLSASTARMAGQGPAAQGSCGFVERKPVAPTAIPAMAFAPNDNILGRRTGKPCKGQRWTTWRW